MLYIIKILIYIIKNLFKSMQVPVTNVVDEKGTHTYEYDKKGLLSKYDGKENMTVYLYSGEDFTRELKKQTGKSRADLYWDKNGKIYSVPKGGGIPQEVGWLKRQ